MYRSVSSRRGPEGAIPGQYMQVAIAPGETKVIEHGGLHAFLRWIDGQIEMDEMEGRCARENGM